MTSRDTLARAFPSLFGPLHWGVVQVSGFEVSPVVPERAMIQSVNVVPFVGDQCVIVEEADGRLTLPGGTRDPDESLMETARRELIEEAGARIESAGPLGYWSCRSERAEPWRTWLPHPNYLRLVFVADVTLRHPPTNPEGGEQIAHVTLVEAHVAIARFTRAGQPELADLYALAADVRATRRLDAATRSAFDAAIAAK